MPIFPKNVERWKPLVSSVLDAELARKPSQKSLIYALGLTISRTVDILLGIIQKESSGNENATGDDGRSIGLMQLNFAAGTPQGVGYNGSPSGLFDPKTNITYGTRYFLAQLERYNNVDKAILAYNAGSFRVNAAGVPINKSYLDAVKEFAGFFLPDPLGMQSSPLPSSTSSDDTLGGAAAVEITAAVEQVNRLRDRKIARAVFTVLGFFVAIALAITPFFCSQ